MFLLGAMVDCRVFGLALAYHTLSLAIEQLSIKIIALQWIFGTSNFCCFSYTSFRHLWSYCTAVYHGDHSRHATNH